MEEVKENSEWIYRVIEEETKLLKNDPTKVFLAGFSQGCAMSVYCGLQYHQRIGGIIGMGGFGFSSISVNKDIFPGIKVLVTHGTEDDIIDFDVAKASYDALNLTTEDDFNFVKLVGSTHSVDEAALKCVKEYFAALGWE